MTNRHVEYVEGQKLRKAGIGIDPEKLKDKVIEVLLREENNLIHYNDNKELFTDLQIADGMTPNSKFEVGVTVGRVSETDGWLGNGTLIVAKTTSGDNVKFLFTDAGKLYTDNGTGEFKQIYLKPEVDELLAQLRDYINEVNAKITVFSADEGVKYYIKVSEEEPSVYTPSNVITFVVDPDDEVDISKIIIDPEYGHTFHYAGEVADYSFSFEPANHTEDPHWEEWLQQLRTSSLEEYFEIEQLENGYRLTCLKMPPENESVGFGPLLRSNSAIGAFYAHIQHPTGE